MLKASYTTDKCQETTKYENRNEVLLVELRSTSGAKFQFILGVVILEGLMGGVSKHGVVHVNDSSM